MEPRSRGANFWELLLAPTTQNSEAFLADTKGLTCGNVWRSAGSDSTCQNPLSEIRLEGAATHAATDR
jgi:hypothetical protein